MTDKIWIGSPLDVRQGANADEALANKSDAEFWDDETGITKVDHQRWKDAQKFESEGWLHHWRTASSDRNDIHRDGFDGYKDVPQDLGRVLEIGCGPFTQLQTIMEGRTITDVTLLDPLLEQYKQLPHCAYKENKFRDYKTKLICSQAENLHGIEEMDTAICINVLEHVQDVGLILSKLHRIIKPGGIVIFGERCYDGLDINAVYDVGHPIRVKMKVFQDWEEAFEPLYRVVPTLGNPLAQEHYFIGKKK